MKCIFSLLFLLSILSVRAQESEDYNKYKDDYGFSVGYIIDQHGNRLDGLIKRDELMLYKKIIFVSPYTKKMVFRPDQLMEYALPPRRFVSDGLFFLEVMQDGKLGLYRKIFFISPVSSAMSGNGVMVPLMTRPTKDNVKEKIIYLLKKKDSNSFIGISKKSGFRGRALSMISDCKKLVSDIKNKVISRKDIEEIVYQYNKSCN